MTPDPIIAAARALIAELAAFNHRGTVEPEMPQGYALEVYLLLVRTQGAIERLATSLEHAQAVLEELGAATERAYKLWEPSNDPRNNQTELIESAGNALRHSRDALRKWRDEQGVS